MTVKCMDCGVVIREKCPDCGAMAFVVDSRVVEIDRVAMFQQFGRVAERYYFCPSIDCEVFLFPEGEGQVSHGLCAAHIEMRRLENERGIESRVLDCRGLGQPASAVASE